MSETAPKTIDAYIAIQPDDVQALLQQVRQTIRAIAPEAQEAMAYGIPTFTLGGRNLVHFGASKGHIGFYPTPSGIAHFKQELSAYKSAKGSVQFPFDKPIPYDLIRRITEFRVAEESLKATAKRPKS